MEVEEINGEGARGRFRAKLVHDEEEMRACDVLSDTKGRDGRNPTKSNS